jgi:hypothetical protein
MLAGCWNHDTSHNRDGRTNLNTSHNYAARSSSRRCRYNHNTHTCRHNHCHRRHLTVLDLGIEGGPSIL